ncbi:MAG: NADPH:quinone oxidoreductase family protein [Myxococcales bacterium]|nr:NADPH:quinone oxidoreductase family protein [Myxococcales bacterium]
MRAACITQLEGPDAIEVLDLPDPTPRKGQVVVAVEHAGLNFPDLLMSRGLYQIRPPLPFAPGGEIAGRVAALGEGVTDFEVGDRVLALTFFGGFATQVAIPAAQLTRVPESMDLETAGAFAFTYATSYHALVDRGRLSAGERLLVLGAAGGVGLAAVEIGAALGAEVVAAASSDEKLALCAAHGATHLVDYAKQDLKEALKALGGVDVVYDPVGGAYSEPSLRALRPGGRHLVVGFAAGDIPAVRLNLVLLKQCEVVGVAWGSWAVANPHRHRANLDALFALHAEGKLRPHISRRYTLDEVPQALRDLDERRVLGKGVIQVAAG